MLRKFQNPLNILCVMTALGAITPAKAELNPPHGCPQGCTDVEVTHDVGALTVSAWYDPCKHRDATPPENDWRVGGYGVRHLCATPDTEVQIGQGGTTQSFRFNAAREPHTLKIYCREDRHTLVVKCE